jgi:predicted GNAT family acetyltransferase
LDRVQPTLEQAETVNSLMLGLCLRLKEFPARIKTRPYLALVEDEIGLALIAVMTQPHKLLVASDRHDVREAAAVLVQNLRADDWPVSGFNGVSPISQMVAQAWTAAAGEAVEVGMQLRLYELKKVSPPAISGQLRQAVSTDTSLLADWAYGFEQEIWGTADVVAALELAERKIQDGEAYFWLDDGQVPVSVAGKSRPTRRTITVNLVYTPPQYRRRGYASAVTAGLSQMLLAEGYEACVLFTNLANPTSNHIYQSIGYRPVCDFTEYRLG